MKNKIFKYLLLIFVITTIFISFALPVFAQTICPICGGDHDDTTIPGFLQKAAYNWSCTVYGGELFDMGDTGPTSVSTVLRFDVSAEGSVLKQLWGMGENLYNAVKLLGIILIITYSMVDLMDKVQGDNLSADIIFRIFLKLFTGILVINSGFDIITLGANFSSSVFETLFQTATNPGAYASGTCVYFDMKNGDWGQALFQLGCIFFPWVTMQIAKLLVSVLCWSRVLDIIIRVCFAPIGMSDIIQGGINSGGWRYFKKLLASLLQGAVILGITKSYGAIAQAIRSTSSSGIGAIVPCLVLAIVCIITMFKASSISSDVVGV